MKQLFIAFFLLVAGHAFSQNIYNRYYGVNSGSVSLKDAIKTYDDHVISLMTGDGQQLFKVNNLGDTIWIKSVGSAENFVDLLETFDNNFIITGNAIAKYDENGNQLWAKQYYGPNGIALENGRLANNGSDLIYFGCEKYSYWNGLKWSSENTFSILKLDNNGDTIWTRQVIDPLFNSISAALSMTFTTVPIEVLVNSSSDIYAIGSLNKTSYSDLYIWKLDGNGNTIFIKYISKPPFEVTGAFLKSDGNISLYGKSNDLYNGPMVLTYDSNGNIIDGNVIEMVNYGTARSVVELQNGNLALAVEGVSVGGSTYQNGAIITDGALGMLSGVVFGGESISRAGKILEHDNGDILTISHTNAFSAFDKLIFFQMDQTGNAVGCHKHISSLQTYPMSASLTAVTLGSATIATYQPYTLIDVVDTIQEYDNNFSITGVLSKGDCNGDQGYIDISMDGTAPYQVTWSNGTIAEDIFDFAGIYYVEVVDANGCIIQDTFQIEEPSPLAISYSAQNVDCFGAGNGAIDLTVSGGTPGYSYNWTTLATSQDLVNLSGGFYQCIISDTNGCEKAISVSITEPQQLVAALSSVKGVSCYGQCDGSIVAFGVGGVGGYSYLWNDPNNQTNDTILNLCYGSYLLKVSDANGCESFTNATINEPLPLTVNVTTWESDCQSENGSAVAQCSGGTSPFSYNWNNTGFGIADSIGGLAVGNGTLTAMDSKGCAISNDYSIASHTTPVELCVITVNEDNKNLLVWQKPQVGNIAGFNIYRNIAGVYTQIGYQPYDSISEYVDNDFGVDPNVTSYRYKIGVLDSCANESTLSNFHETIHLTSSVGLSGEFNLIWDNYEGILFNEYLILRDTIGNGTWDSIGSVLSTSFTYVDNTVPSTVTSLKYAIEVVLPSTCTAEKVNDHNSTRSNRSTISAPNNSVSSIDDFILKNVTVYPNPVNSFLTIKIASNDWKYMVLDVSGRQVITEKVVENNTEIIDLSSLENGVYFLQVQMGKNTIVKRIVKQ